jgi:ureidoacrylate peracid hydrolase
MHKIAISDEVMQRVALRRGGPKLYGRVQGPRAALVVIDMQNAFLLPGMPAEVAGATDIIPQINRLAEGFRRAGGTVVWIKMTIDRETESWSTWFDCFMKPDRRAAMLRELSPGGKGHELHADLAVRDQDVVLQKTRYSAFIQNSSDLDSVLHERGIDTVAIAGTLTNVCCEASARDAMMLNYRTFFLSDANATHSDAEHNASLAAVMQYFGEVLSTSELLERLDGAQAQPQRAAG